MTDRKYSQWHVITHDKWLLSCLTILPVILALSIYWIFSQSLARDLPIGVVDLQKSSLSRKLIREFDATSALKVAHRFNDISSAKRAFVAKKIYGYLIIPRHFDRDIYLGKTPQTSVFYNSQFILVGKLINSAAQKVNATFNAQVGIAKQLTKGNNNALSAFSKTIAIRTQITPMFNKNANYAQFLVTAIVPALWQIFIVLSTVLFLAANHRIYGLNKIFAENPVRNLFSISAFYLPFFVVQGLAFLVWFYFNLNWPISGSLLPLIYAQLITAIACIIMGCFFFLLTLDPARAMSFAAAYTAPSFAFMGVTFPDTDMGIIAKIWRSLLPISHYIEAQISQISYGLPAWKTIYDFTPSMLGYLFPLFLIFLLIKKQLKKLDISNEPI